MSHHHTVPAELLTRGELWFVIYLTNPTGHRKAHGQQLPEQRYWLIAFCTNYSYQKKNFEMLHWMLIAFCTNYIFFKVMQGKFHCFKKNRKVLTKIIRWKYFYLLENIWFTNIKFLIAFCTNYLVLLDKNNFENSFLVQGPVTFKLGFFHRKVALLVKIV